MKVTKSDLYQQFYSKKKFLTELNTLFYAKFMNETVGHTCHESNKQHKQPSREGITNSVQQRYSRLSALIGDLDKHRKKRSRSVRIG